jgi:hypothetical protein
MLSGAGQVMLIGQRESSFLEIRAQAREDPSSQDFLDGNWIECRVEVRSGGFGAAVDASLRAEAFASFRDQLRELSKTLKGNASFIPMEPWVTINLKGDCRHELEALCLVRDQLSGGNVLHATIKLEASFLSEILAGLDRICEAFPVVGR